MSQRNGCHNATKAFPQATVYLSLLKFTATKAKAGQNCIYTLYMTVYSVISLPQITYPHRIYIWFWPTLQKQRATLSLQSHGLWSTAMHLLPRCRRASWHGGKPKNQTFRFVKMYTLEVKFQVRTYDAGQKHFTQPTDVHRTTEPREGDVHGSSLNMPLSWSEVM